MADGDFLDPARRDERSAGIPLLIGHTSHDWSFFLADAPWYPAVDEAGLVAALARVVPGADPGLVAPYRAAHPDESAPLLLSRIASDRSFGRMAARVAEERAASGSPVYRYEFAVETDAGPAPLGATHCLEIPYVFGTGDVVPLAGSAPGRDRIADEVADAWLAFAESGRPTAPGGVAWEQFRPGEPTTMRIGSESWGPLTSALSAELTPALL